VLQRSDVMDTPQSAQPADPNAPNARSDRAAPSAWLVRWLRRALVVGLVLSAFFHAGFLGAAGMIRGGGGVGAGATAGAGAAGPVVVEVAAMAEDALPPASDAELPVNAPVVENPTSESMPGLTLAPITGGSGSPDAGGLGEMGEGLGGAGSGEGLGAGEGSGGAGGGTSFFGVEARGSRIAFICDISGSMTGMKIGALKRELVSAIDGLTEGSQFSVIFFESQAIPIGQQERWIEANLKNREWAFTQIKALEPRGGTNPEPAFLAAMALRPRPDAIYFMTDGLFDSAVVNTIARLQSAGRRVPVHCIAFGDRSAEALMRRIAAESGGSFTFVEGPNP
jgi:hypothetical protein